MEFCPQVLWHSNRPACPVDQHVSGWCTTYLPCWGQLCVCVGRPLLKTRAATFPWTDLMLAGCWWIKERLMTQPCLLVLISILVKTNYMTYHWFYLSSQQLMKMSNTIKNIYWTVVWILGCFKHTLFNTSATNSVETLTLSLAVMCDQLWGVNSQSEQWLSCA